MYFFKVFGTEEGGCQQVVEFYNLAREAIIDEVLCLPVVRNKSTKGAQTLH